MANDAKRYSEAENALRASLKIDANHGISHLVVAVVKMNENHFADALAPLQETSRLEPAWAVGWLLSSICAENLAHHDQSLSFAKRATSIEPDWIYTWIQLARTEKAAGHPAPAGRASRGDLGAFRNEADLP